jgi:hypothetical protein
MVIISFVPHREKDSKREDSKQRASNHTKKVLNGEGNTMENPCIAPIKHRQREMCRIPCSLDEQGLRVLRTIFIIVDLQLDICFIVCRRHCWISICNLDLFLCASPLH